MRRALLSLGVLALALFPAVRREHRAAVDSAKLGGLIEGDVPTEGFSNTAFTDRADQGESPPYVSESEQFPGIAYDAIVDADGLRFREDGVEARFRTLSVEHGATRVASNPGRVVRTAYHAADCRRHQLD